MIWLLGIGRWLKEAATALFGIVARYPWQAALMVALCLSAWLWHGRNEARADLADIKAAQEQARGAQKRVNDAAETHYKEVANVADKKHETMVADAWDATAAYVARNRVQPQDRTCKAPAPAADPDPGVPAEVPSGVVMDQADVHACANLYAYGSSAHEWAQSLKLPENLLPEK